MSDIILYGDPRSTYFRTARMAAEEKGISYDMAAPGDAGRDYGQIHPFGKIPAMVHGDVTIYETAGIATYIDEAFDGPALAPSTALEKALMWQWVSAVNDYFYDTIIKNYVLQYVFPKGAGGQPDMVAIQAALPDVKHRVMVLDQAVAAHDFVTGDQFTIADMFICPIMTYLGRMPEAPEIFADCQNIGRAGEAAMARASYQNTLPPEAEAAE
jgi:glutathione S-transferase